MALVWFAGLGHRPLLSPDEGRYAEIAREMAVSGDFVTPRLNGLKYFEKPPLQAWLTAIAFQWFGTSETVARLWPALYGAGTCLIAFVCVRRRRGLLAAQVAALCCAASAWVCLNGHFLSLDMGLTFWLTLILAGLFRCLEAPHNRRGGLAVWIGIAGAFLSKGLVALVIPGAAMVITALLVRRPRLLLAVPWWPGLPLMLALVAPWLVLVQWRNPGFFDFFVIHEHFERFTSQVHQRVEPGWYFIPVFLVGAMPWLGHWLAAALARKPARPMLSARPARSTGPTTPADRDPAAMLLLTWSVFVIGFFSLSGSKLPSYILPMFPAMAIWFGLRVAGLSGRVLRLCALPALAGALALAAAARPLVRTSDDGEAIALAVNYLPWILTGAMSMAVGALAAWWLAGGGREPARRPAQSIAALALGAMLSFQCLQWGHGELGERLSGKGLAQRVLASEGRIDPATPFFAVATWDQSLPFYLQRTFTLVDWRDEMDMGLRDQPELNGPDEAGLLRRWADLEHAYILVDLDRLAGWQAAGLPKREVARNTRRAVIARNTAK